MAMAMASSQVARTCRMELREGRKKGQRIVAKRDEEKKVPPTRDEPARRIGRPAGREGRVRVRGSRRVQVPRQIAGGELVDSCNPFPAQQWAHPHPHPRSHLFQVPHRERALDSKILCLWMRMKQAVGPSQNETFLTDFVLSSVSAHASVCLPLPSPLDPPPPPRWVFPLGNRRLLEPHSERLFPMPPAVASPNATCCFLSLASRRSPSLPPVSRPL